MINTLLILAANAPSTGDDFPKGLLIVIVLAAVLLAVGTAVFSKRKSESDEDDETDEDGSDEDTGNEE